jgi:nucleoside-diphosphate-sugar epimerase
MREGQQHILITGGAGYIGSVLVGSLLRRGDWVTVVDNLQFGGESLLAYMHHPRFQFNKCDVVKAGEITDVISKSKQVDAPKVTALVHLAAIVGFPACQAVGRDLAWRTNVDGVRQVFQEADSADVERLIFSSTYSVYGANEGGELVTEESALNPQSLYAETKIAAETLLLEGADSANCKPVILRFATLYGASPRLRFDLIINQFVLEAYLKGELVIYERSYSRSFVHIQDVVRGLIMAIDTPMEIVRGQVFNLGDESGNYTKDEIVTRIQSVLPKTEIRYKDLSFEGDMRDVRVSFEKIKKVFGFRTQWTVEQGIDEILTLLQNGMILEPHSDRYRNAEFIVQ